MENINPHVTNCLYCGKKVVFIRGEQPVCVDCVNEAVKNTPKDKLELSEEAFFDTKDFQ